MYPAIDLGLGTRFHRYLTVGMSKQLYDLEAQYQMPLIRKYQTQLEQERNAERERDEKFKQYVLEHQ